MRLNQNILFVSHKANLSGAPLLLLSIIAAYKKRHPHAVINILSLEHGPLVKDFEKLGRTYIWRNSNFKTNSAAIKGLTSYANRILFIGRAIFILNKLKSCRLIFFNTITNGHIHKKLLITKCKSICYVHEMEAAIHMLTNHTTLNTVINNTSHFIAVSQAVKDNLIKNHNVNKSAVSVINTPLNIVKRNKADHKDFITAFKRENNINEQAIVIGITGNNEWRKGFDLLTPLVTLYFNLFPDSDVYFTWKGFNRKNTSAYFDEFDIKKMPSNKRIIIKDHDGYNISQMACFDIHLLLSREDPYPLVTLEAASFSIPTICFENAGGTNEFINDNCGFSVPYLDLYKMAHVINILTTDAVLRKTIGKNAQKKLAIQHNEDENMDAIASIIDKEMYTSK